MPLFLTLVARYLGMVILQVSVSLSTDQSELVLKPLPCNFDAGLCIFGTLNILFVALWEVRRRAIEEEWVAAQLARCFLAVDCLR